MRDKKVLIVGGSGLIGKHLYEYFDKKKELIAGTYYNTFKEGMIYFNLKNPNLNKLEINFEEVSHAIICSAITLPDECKRNETKAYEINVKGTKELLEQFWERNIFPVWFSSEYVFNGKKGNYTEVDERNPNTIYGNHKKIIEEFLLDTDKPFLISRLGKIFGTNFESGAFLTTIAKQLKDNETLHCAEDQIFSPTYVQDLVRILDLSLDRKLMGLYNMASLEPYNRFQIAEMIKSQLRIETGKVIPCSLNDFNFLDSRPLNTSLNSDKIIKETGFRFTSLKDCIKKLEKIVV